VGRFLIAIILALLIQSAPRDASAQGRSVDYYLTGGSELSVEFVDVKSIKIEGNIRKYWVESHKVKPTEYGVSFSKSFYTADCVNETNAMIYAAYYDALSNYLFGGESNQPKSRVVPGTVGDSTFQFVCASPAERLQMDARRVDNTFDAAANWFADAP